MIYVDHHAVFLELFVILELNSLSPHIKKCFIEVYGQNIPECQCFCIWFYFILFCFILLMSVNILYT